MKKTIIALGLLQTISINAQAYEPSLVQGPFWRAPQVTEMSKKISFVEPELKKRCEGYSSLVNSYKDFDINSTIISKFDRLRKTELSASVLGFKATFYVVDAPVENFFEQEVETNVGNAETEKLPFYNQNKAVTFGFIKDVRNIEPKLAADAVTQFSRKLGLEDATADFSYNNSSKLIISVSALDLACDLMNGKATLKVNMPSFVRLPKDAAAEMNSFYNSKIAPQLDSILGTTEDSHIKAARLGFRLGGILDENNSSYDDTKVEKQIGNMMDVLFTTKNMIPSANVTDSYGKKLIKATSPVNGSGLTLTLGL